MQQLTQPQKSMLLGAAAATVTGLLFGAALKVEVAPTSSYGQQLLVSKPVDRERNAFDNWYPAEAAPPPVYQMAALRDEPAAATTGDDIDRQIARLLNFGRSEPTPVYQPAPPPVQVAQREPEPYVPTARGDILAPAAYEPPPAETPRWGWALPNAEEAPYPADAAPGMYPDGAAG